MTTQGRRPSGGPELARWTGPDDDPPARPSLCGTHLLLHWHGPLMTGVWMELCPACDARRSAARAFIQWYRDPDRDPKAGRRRSALP